jgi:toxin ParE1/3/4
VSYRLTPKARDDLENIYRYSYENFGERQADIYYDSLLECLDLLGDNPRMGREFNEIEHGLRRHEHASHVVYYEIDNEGVLILRILGARQDPAQHL